MVALIESIELAIIGFLPFLKDLGGVHTLLMVCFFIMFSVVLFVVVRSAYFTEETQN